MSRPFLQGLRGVENILEGRRLWLLLFFNVSLDWLTSDKETDPSAQALDEKEALLLYAYRHMKTERVEMFLNLMLKSVDEKVSYE